MFLPEDISMFIFSWKHVTQNAIALYNAIQPHFPNCTIVHCDEHVTLPPEIRHIPLDDSYYYGGQFDTAVKHTPTNHILSCVVGDVDPNANWLAIRNKLLQAMNEENVGIYAPNVDFTEHTQQGPLLTGSLYHVHNTDCTVWFLHPSVMQRLRAIPYREISNLGWGIDSTCIWESRRKGLHVVRDYSELVRQPEGTNYSKPEAFRQMYALQAYYMRM